MRNTKHPEMITERISQMLAAIDSYLNPSDAIHTVERSRRIDMLDRLASRAWTATLVASREFPEFGEHDEACRRIRQDIEHLTRFHDIYPTTSCDTISDIVNEIRMYFRDDRTEVFSD